MEQRMRSFGSDNHSGVHPAVMEAIQKANFDHAPAYGDDLWTAEAVRQLKEIFGETASPFLVFNGTGANVIAMRACCQSYHSIFAAQTAHIAVDECNAPAFMSGAALKEIATPDGKLTPALLEPLLHGFGFEHHSQPKVVYIAECTELGTVYTPAEIKKLAEFVHHYGMYLHVDGARLANAAASLNLSVKEITTDCNIDILSFGGTKNGCMMAESVISFRPELTENLKYIRKQSTQLYSKMRYVAAQFIAYLSDDLLYHNALHANQMATVLREKLEAVGCCHFTQPTQANMVFLQIPAQLITELLKKHFFYVWDELQNEIRFVTSWDTTMDDIDTLVNDLSQIFTKTAPTARR